MCPACGAAVECVQHADCVGRSHSRGNPICRDPLDTDGFRGWADFPLRWVASVDEGDDPSGHVLVDAGQSFDFDGDASLLGDLTDNAFLEVAPFRSPPET